MKILYFNDKGVGGAPKILSLKRLLKLLEPKRLMIQETKVARASAQEAIEPWLKDRSFSTTNLKGLFGGLITTWSLAFRVIDTFVISFGIHIDLEIKNWEYK
jgi:hypothetical protein